jgi:U3 small nucleolar RNA-associated protein 14
VTTVAIDPAFAAALGDVIDRARHGDDVTAALARARRLLVGEPRAADAAVPWSGAWTGRGGTR